MVGLRMTGQSALIVIDVQDAVVETAWDRDGVVSRIAALVDRARVEGVPVVYVQHEIPARSPMARGADGWRIDDRIAPRQGEWIISRQYPDAFASTPLADTLDAMDVTHLVIAGAGTDCCVQATVYRAIAEGWHVTLASDCHTTSDREWEGGGATGEQIVRHANEAMGCLVYPGRAVEVIPHDAVTFSVAVMQGAA
jgi:nicotinamidase-related amidase